MAYQKISKICPSKLINAWNVHFTSGNYVITPAHVALHIQGGKYQISSFLKDLSYLDWHIPRLYDASNENSFMYDCAWAKIPDNAEVQNSFSSEKIADSLTCEIFFRQPYDAHARWDASQSTLGSVKAQVYPSPKSPLLEALDVGFRGMSGALATTIIQGELKVVGMLLRRGNPINFKKDVSKVHESKASNPEQNEILNNSPPNLTSSENALFQLFNQQFQLIHNRFDTMEKRFNTLEKRFDTLEKRFDTLEKKVLTRDDLDRLLNVTAMRRSIVMPCYRIEQLMSDSVEIKQLQGKLVE